MKFALISYSKLKGDKNWNLILETVEDVQQYFQAASKISAEQFWDVWASMKKGYDSAHSLNGRRHQSSVIAAATLIDIKARDVEVPLVEACEIHDKLLYCKLQTMYSIVINGTPIRLSAQGGYSQFDDFFQTHEEQQCDEKMMREYLVTGDQTKFHLTFTKNVIVIENGSILSDKLSSLLPGYNNFEPIFNFKYRTDNWKGEDFFKLFDDAVKNGLYTIYAETTLYFKEQFEQLRYILIKVMQNNLDKKLTVNLLLNSDVAEFEKYSENLPVNLILNLL